MASGMDGLLAWLTTAQVLDVIAPGYIDRDGDLPEFRPWGDTVAFSSEGDYLRLDSVRSHGQLQMGVVTGLVTPEPIREEELEFATASQGDQFLHDASSSYSCTRVRYVTDPDSEPEKGLVTCAEFTFNDRHTVFADPQWHFGILLGGAGAYEHWWDFHHADDRHTLVERVWHSPGTRP